MRQLAKIVEREAFYWGDSIREGYFAAAEKYFDEDWTSIVRPFLEGYPINYAHTLDLACGRGRNSAALSPLAGRMTLVDVNPENIAACTERFRGRSGVTFVKNNGFDLRAVRTRSITFVYSFDSMVHFDLDIVIAYLREISRVLSTNGYGFIHHSNYTAAPTVPFTANPHWRNFMSRELFAHLCVKAGLVVEAQKLMDWEVEPNLDCLTLFRKPAPPSKPPVAKRIWRRLPVPVRQNVARIRDLVTRAACLG